MIKKIIYVDMDDTICQYKKEYNYRKEKFKDLDYPQKTHGFFESLEPVDYALPCLEQLQESGKYDIWFATAPSVKNRHCYIEKANWIYDYLGEEWQRKLIIINDKSKLIGDYLIDDCANGRGQEKFQGELIQFGHGKYSNWIDVTSYLLEK